MQAKAGRMHLPHQSFRQSLKMGLSLMLYDMNYTVECGMHWSLSNFNSLNQIDYRHVLNEKLMQKWMSSALWVLMQESRTEHHRDSSHLWKPMRMLMCQSRNNLLDVVLVFDIWISIPGSVHDLTRQAAEEPAIRLAWRQASDDMTSWHPSKLIHSVLPLYEI